jgi:hypothetical protein
MNSFATATVSFLPALNRAREADFGHGRANGHGAAEECCATCRATPPHIAAAALDRGIRGVSAKHRTSGSLSQSREYLGTLFFHSAFSIAL